LAGCHPTNHFEAEVQIERVSPVQRDETGRVLTTDVEVIYVSCPGDQREILRGGAEFSECVASLAAPQRLKAKIEHRWTAEENYDSVITQLGTCKRPPDPLDEASYKLVRDCSDWRVNGARVGFQCNYSDKKQLIKSCPWFKRH
jgi:hypothetical protein